VMQHPDPGPHFVGHAIRGKWNKLVHRRETALWVRFGFWLQVEKDILQTL